MTVYKDVIVIPCLVVALGSEGFETDFFDDLATLGI